MEEMQDKFLIDVKAEKQSLNPSIQLEETKEETVNISPDILNVQKPDQALRAEMQSVTVNIQPQEDIESSRVKTNELNSETLRVEANVTGLNYFVQLNSIETLTDQVSDMQSKIKNLTSDLNTSYESINDLATFQRESDPFEERITVLPTNLIFVDRTQRVIDTTHIY